MGRIAMAALFVQLFLLLFVGCNAGAVDEESDAIAKGGVDEDVASFRFVLPTRLIRYPLYCDDEAMFACMDEVNARIENWAEETSDYEWMGTCFWMMFGTIFRQARYLDGAACAVDNECAGRPEQDAYLCAADCEAAFNECVGGDPHPEPCTNWFYCEPPREQCFSACGVRDYDIPVTSVLPPF